MSATAHIVMNDIFNTHSEDSKEPLTTVQPASTVFKSSLLELFKQCTLCQNECKGNVRSYSSEAAVFTLWTQDNVDQSTNIKDTPA